jgi:CHASE1-domain containing sensor protein/two-component sensor histidine kinase
MMARNNVTPRILGLEPRYAVMPAIVLLLSLLITAALSIYVHDTNDALDRGRFERLADGRLDDIRDRMEIYNNFLRGAAGLLAVKPDASRTDWKAYVERSRIQELYPGMQGIGFAKRFSASQRDDVIRSMRAQGLDTFTIRPDHDRPDYTAILYLEPLDRRNQAAIGFDMLSDATRREAMERARDLGRAAMSGKVELVQEIDADKQPGLLLYVPVFAGAMIPSSLEERRQRLIGWAYTPFRSVDLFGHSFSRDDRAELDFSVFDGAQEPDRLLYRSNPITPSQRVPLYAATRPIEIAGRQWIVSMASTRAFERGSNRAWTGYVFAAGLLTTMLLSGAAWAQARAAMSADRAREELRAVNSTLEDRVVDRTAELRKAHAALRDINENLEQIVAARTSDLEEANEEIQRFAYIVSHDLRAPLVNIMGFTSELESVREELLSAGALPKDDPTREQVARDFNESLSFIRAGTAKMDGLIGAILKISREGRRSFQPEPLDMSTLVKNLADSIHHQVDAVGASIEVDELLPLTADRLAVEQVFSNLLDNAVKYLDPGRPGQIRVRTRDMGSRIAYDVEDNGRGIAEADHARVFQLFRRAGIQDRPGEGIGLAHVSALVRSLGGRIELNSALGAGTTFRVILPKVPPRSGTTV